MKFRIPNFEFRWIRKLLVILILLGAAGWLLFRTGAGRDVIVRTVNARAEGRLQLEGASGAWPQQGRVARVAVADERGTWLVITNLSWDLRLRDVLRPPFRVRALRAESLDWLRLPVRRTNAAPSRVPALEITELGIGHVRPASNLVAGTALDLAVRGGIVRRREGWLVDLRGTAAESRSEVSALLRTGDRMAIAVQVNEPRGGPLSDRLRNGTNALQATVWAERMTNDWRGSLEIQSDGRLARAGWRYAAPGVWHVDAMATNLLLVAGGRDLQVQAARLHWSASERRGRYQAAVRWDGEPVWAEGAMIRRPNGWSLPHTLLTAEGVRARVYAQRLEAWSADIRFSFQRGGAVARWLPGGWDAEGRGQVSWSNGALRLRAVLPEVQQADLRVRNLEAMVWKEAASPLRLDLAVQAWQQGGQTVLEEMHVLAGVEALPAGWQVKVEKAAARQGVTPLRLEQPLQVVLAGGSLAWSTARVAIAEGEVVATGRLGSEVELHAEWRGIPMGVAWRGMPAGWSGSLAGRLEVSGSAAAPSADLRLQAREVRVREPAAGVELSPAEVTVDLRVGGGRANLEAAWFGWSEEPLRAQAEGPLAWSLRPWRLQVPRREPGRGHIEGRLDLARLERVLDLRGSRVRGRLEGALDLAGTLDEPVIQGRLAVRDGQVDIPETGTSLRDLTLVLEGDREQLRIREGSARAGSAGRLGVEGAVRFDPAHHFPLAATVTLQRAEIWQRGGSRAVVDGLLALTGSVRALVLAGEVNVPTMQVKLGRRRPAVPVLPVQGLATEVSAAGPTAPAWGKRVMLRVAVRIPRQAEISGRGLEANWWADLVAGGTLAEPVVTGNVQARRGYFLFMGRRFDVENAWIGLDGRRPPQPTLNLVATSRAADMTARLQVTGSVREPVLELTSDPAYPTDEVLSRLLFGKSADSISAFQAVRLAHGLNVLRGKGTSLDVLDRGQSLLRVDQLDLRQDSEQGMVSSVSVGKYIGPRVFVQGQTALDGSGDVIAVEVDLAPSLTLQTEASPGIREGIGLKWRRDY